MDAPEVSPVLRDRVARILRAVDQVDTEAAEYNDFAEEVITAFWKDGLEITPRNDVLWSQEEGMDVGWGTAISEGGN